MNFAFVKGVRFNRLAPAGHKTVHRATSRDNRLGRRIQAGVGIAVSLVGLVAYLYLLGGLVMWLRFTAAQLPADDAIAALDNKRLLAMGIKALAFEVMLLGGLLVATWLAWYLARVFSAAGGLGKTKKATLSPKPRHRSPAGASVILLAFALGIALAALSRDVSSLSDWSPAIVGLVAGFTSALMDDSESAAELLTSRPMLWGISLALAALAVFFMSAPAGVAVLLLIGLARFSGRLSKLPSVRNLAHLIPAVLILGACLSIVAAAYVATPPVTLDRVSVATVNGHLLSGGYIGRSSDGLIMATCRADRSDPTVSDSVRLRVIAPGQARRTILGGSPYAFDYGKNPSLFDLAKHYIGGSAIGESLPTVSIDPRRSELVCGAVSAPHADRSEPTPARSTALTNAR